MMATTRCSRRAFLRASSVAAGALVLPRPGLAQSDKYGGLLRVSVTFGLSTINPIMHISGAEWTATRWMYSNLTRLNIKREVVPDLAESWSAGEGARTWTFRRRPGVKFHSGRELTADERERFGFWPEEARRAFDLAEALRRDLFFPEDVEEKLKDLDEEDRRLVGSFLRTHSFPSPLELSEEVWGSVESAVESLEATQKALRTAKVLVRRFPRQTNHIAALGGALYRAGNYLEAVESLEQCKEIFFSSDVIPTLHFPGPLRAMGLFRLGRETEAREIYEDARREVRHGLGSNDFWKWPIFGEAQAMIYGPLGEAARSEVDSTFENLIVKSDVLEALRGSPDTGHREISIEMARAWKEDGWELNQKAWEIVRQPGRDSESYGKALRLAQAAVALDGESGDIVNTLGVAQFRAGNLSEALLTLEKSDRLNRQSRPSDAAFLAMTLFKLAKEREARKEYNRLLDLVKKPEFQKDQELQSILGEVRSLLE
jgi:tetratricopeptide (TPR) repeat protein